MQNLRTYLPTSFSSKRPEFNKKKKYLKEKKVIYDGDNTEPPKINEDESKCDELRETSQSIADAALLDTSNKATTVKLKVQTEPPIIDLTQSKDETEVKESSPRANGKTLSDSTTTSTSKTVPKTTCVKEQIKSGHVDKPKLGLPSRGFVPSSFEFDDSPNAKKAKKESPDNDCVKIIEHGKFPKRLLTADMLCAGRSTGQLSADSKPESVMQRSRDNSPFIQRESRNGEQKVHIPFLDMPSVEHEERNENHKPVQDISNKQISQAKRNTQRETFQSLGSATALKSGTSDSKTYTDSTAQHRIQQVHKQHIEDRNKQMKRVVNTPDYDRAPKISREQPPWLKKSNENNVKRDTVPTSEKLPSNYSGQYSMQCTDKPRVASSPKQQAPDRKVMPTAKKQQEQAPVPLMSLAPSSVDQPQHSVQHVKPIVDDQMKSGKKIVNTTYDYDHASKIAEPPALPKSFYTNQMKRGIVPVLEKLPSDSSGHYQMQRTPNSNLDKAVGHMSDQEDAYRKVALTPQKQKEQAPIPLMNVEISSVNSFAAVGKMANPDVKFVDDNVHVIEDFRMSGTPSERKLSVVAGEYQQVPQDVAWQQGESPFKEANRANPQKDQRGLHSHQLEDTNFTKREHIRRPIAERHLGQVTEYHHGKGESPFKPNDQHLPQGRYPREQGDSRQQRECVSFDYKHSSQREQGNYQPDRRDDRHSRYSSESAFIMTSINKTYNDNTGSRAPISQNYQQRDNNLARSASSGAYKKRMSSSNPYCDAFL